jgi:hypothetical protein
MIAILCNTIVSGEGADGRGGVSRRFFARNQLLVERDTSMARFALGQH